MGQADTFLYREDFQGRYGAVPTEIAPRLTLIHSFPVGRVGVPEGLSDLPELMREYGNGFADPGLDFIRVFAGQTYDGVQAGRFEAVRVAAANATLARSAPYATTVEALEVPQGYFESVGPGEDYNGVTPRLTVTRIEDVHPVGAGVRVFRVEVPAVDPGLPPEVFDNIVFSSSAGGGTSAFDQTNDASTINDPLAGSRTVRWRYSPTATGTLGAALAVGDTIDMPLSGGTDGEMTQGDWEDAIDACQELNFRWFVPLAPTEAARGYAVGALKKANFELIVVNQMYGETLSAFIEARGAYGNTVTNGCDMYFWGNGEHILTPGREIPFSAAYLGRWSAKIAATGLGGEYPVGNEPLGYRSIASGDRLKRAQQEQLAALNINYAKQLTGGFGVHGYWTGDKLVDRMGDAAKRVFWNDVLRRLAVAFIDLAQNRGNTVVTRKRIKVVGDAAIQPYVTAGYAIEAATGTYTYEEVIRRFEGLGWPSFNYDWAYYLAQIGFAPTLGGVFVHATDQEIVGLVSLIQNAG